MSRPRLLAAFAVLLGIASTASAQIAPAYLVTDLGSLGGATGTSRAYGVSNNGQFVTGLTTVGAVQNAYRYNVATGTMTSLGVLAGTTNSVGYAVNNSGTVVGYSTTGTLPGTIEFDFNVADRGFVATGATPTAIPILTNNGFSGQPYQANRGQGVNNAGEISGYAFNLTQADFQGFRSSGATPTPLNYLAAAPPLNAGTLNLGFTINNSGQIAAQGDRDTGNPATNPYFAIRYPSGSTTPTAMPLAAGFPSAYGFGINDAGNIVGYADNNGAGAPKPYFTDGATATALGLLTGGDSGFANAIGNNGLVVGQSNTVTNGTLFRAVAWNGSTAVDLNSLLTGPGSAGWVLRSAEAVSDSGQIVGFGVNPGGVVRAFLLTPVPEPGTFAMVGLAMAGAWGLRRLRRK